MFYFIGEDQTAFGMSKDLQILSSFTGFTARTLEVGGALPPTPN